MAGINFSVSNSTTVQHEVQWTDIILGVFLFTIVITTIVGNSFVLIAIFRDKRLQTSFNCYIVNLAVTDILVAVTAMAFFTIDNILKYWPFGEFMCGVWIFFDYGMTFVSVFTLLIISVDRFWSVTWSMHYKVHHTKKKVLILILCVWLFMMVLWVPPFVMDRVNNSLPLVCKWDPAYNPEFVVVIAVVGHHGSCFILLFCYVRVFYVLRKRSKITVGNRIEPSTTAGPDISMKASTSATHYKTEEHKNTAKQISGNPKEQFSIESVNGRSSVWTTNNCKKTFQSGAKTHVAPLNYSVSFKHVAACNESIDASGTQTEETVGDKDIKKYEKKEAKVFKTLTYIIVGYVLCWVPFHIVFDISAIAPEIVPEKVYIATFWLAYLNSTLNPFLYNFSSPEFKGAFKKIIFSWKHCGYGHT